MRLPTNYDEIPDPATLKPTAPVREGEDFIALVFNNEVWMGQLDFKSDKSLLKDDQTALCQSSSSFSKDIN